MATTSGAMERMVLTGVTISLWMMIIAGCSGSTSGSAESDTQPPSAPIVLSASVSVPNQIDLQWSESIDDVSLYGYEIYRAGSDEFIVGTTASLYRHSDLAADSERCYEVVAVDAAGNKSDRSPLACAVTLKNPDDPSFSVANTALTETGFSAVTAGTSALVAFVNETGEVMTQAISPSAGERSGASLLISENAGFPACAFDGSRYLVAWTSAGQINGQFVATDNTLSGGPFTIGTGELDGMARPLQFFAGSYWLVSRSGTALLIRSITSAGSVGPQSEVGENVREYAVAYDGSRILIVWVDNAGDAAVYGRFVDPLSGNPDGAVLLIDAAGDPSDNPLAVEFDGTNYLVVWEEEIGGWDGQWDLQGRLVSPAGLLLGSGSLAIAASETLSEQFPSIAFDGSRYLVVYNDVWNGDSYGQYVDTDGVLSGASFLINPESGRQFAVATGFANDAYLLLLNTNINWRPEGCTEGCTFAADDVRALLLAP